MRVLVMTCDKNAYVLPIFFHFFEKMWPDCPWHVDVLGGLKTASYLQDCPAPSRACMMPDDSCWSDMLIDYLNLELAEEEFLIIFGEDYIIADKVDNKKVRSCLNVISVDRDVQFIRLMACPGPTLPWVRSMDLGEFDKEHAPYLSSLTPTIWRKEHLLRMLKRGETPWAVEIHGSNRARDLPGIYLGTTTHLIPCMNYLVRGKVNPDAVAEVERKW